MIGTEGRGRNRCPGAAGKRDEHVDRPESLCHVGYDLGEMVAVTHISDIADAGDACCPHFGDERVENCGGTPVNRDVGTHSCESPRDLGADRA